MTTAPAQTPTEWVGVSSRGRTYEVTSIVFVCVAFISVVLRLVARLTSIRKLLIDDYICIAAQIALFGLLALAIEFTETAGMGWHTIDLPPAQIERFLKLFFSAEVLYGIVSLLYKLAVIFLYRNIFGEVRAFSIVSWVLVALSISWWLGAFFSSIFQCTPVRRAWNPTIPGTCINQEAFILGNGICNLILDFLILIAPIPMIWRLNLSTRKKVALTAMFLIGSVVCIASILRVTTSFPLDFEDTTYTVFHVAIWSEIEPSIGIIAACLPTLRQFFFRHMPGRTKVSYAGGYNGGYNGGYSAGYAGKNTPFDSTARSNTAVALTGWKSNEAYTEVGSPVHTPKSSNNADIEAYQLPASNYTSTFLDMDPTAPNVRDEDMDNRSIMVRKEVTVTTE